MAVEQQLGRRVGAHGGVELDRRQQRPATGDARRARAGRQRRPRRCGAEAAERTAPTGVPAAPWAGCRAPVGGAAAGEQGAHRGEGVAGDAARPDEVPERRREGRRRRWSRPGRPGCGRSARRRRRGRRAPRCPPSEGTRSGSGPGRVRWAESARCSETQPSSPGSDPWPHQSTSPVAISSSSRAGGVVGDPGRAARATRRRSRAARPRSAARRRAARPSRPRSRPPTPCQPWRKRESSTGVTGSTSARSAASERRRSIRSTSASQNSVPPPPGGQQLALDDPARATPAGRRAARGHGRAEAVGAGHLGGVEGHVGAGVAGDEVAERVGHRLEEGLRHAGGQRDAEGVAQPGGVVDRRPAVLAGDAHRDDLAGAARARPSHDSTSSPVVPSRQRARMPSVGQRAERAQQVERRRRRRGPPARG